MSPEVFVEREGLPLLAADAEKDNTNLLTRWQILKNSPARLTIIPRTGHEAHERKFPL
jgi:hypothetical protein